MKTLAKKSHHFGFTLIELLATLTVMAIIAAILFPFIGNYTSKADRNTNMRSLRLMQDAMDRYRMLNDGIVQWPEDGWGPFSTSSGKTQNLRLLNHDTTDQIIENLTEPGPNQTLRSPTDGLSGGSWWHSGNLVIFRLGSSEADYSWEVAQFRRKLGKNGISRKGTVLFDDSSGQEDSWVADAQVVVNRSFE